MRAINDRPYEMDGKTILDKSHASPGDCCSPGRVAAILAVIFNLKFNPDVQFDLRYFKLRKDVVAPVLTVGIPHCGDDEPDGDGDPVYPDLSSKAEASIP